MHTAWRRQSSTEWALREIMDLCDENMAWTTGSSLARTQRRRFPRGCCKGNELHAAGDMFAKQIEPEPAPEDLVDWAMAEASDDGDDAPTPDAPAPPEPELIDTPPAPASAPPMSNLERCIAQRLVYGAGPRSALQKNCHLQHISASLCCLTCRLGRVSRPRSCFHVLTTSPRLPDSDRQKRSLLVSLTPLLVRNTDQGV